MMQSQSFRKQPLFILKNKAIEYYTFRIHLIHEIIYDINIYNYNMGVVNMKKSIIYVLLLLFVIGTGVIIYMINQTDTETKTTLLPKQTKTTADENSEKSEKKEESEPEKDSVKTVGKQLSESVANVIQGTINYFSNKETQVVAIGDSLTQGVGDEKNEGGYVGILDQTINKNSQLVKFDNFGVRGNRTDQLLKRLDNEDVSAAIEDADIIIITIGANDIMQVVKENFTNLTFKDFVQERVNYEERLRSIFDKINELNPDTDDVYLIGFYNPFEQYFSDIKELNIIVDEWNKTSKAVVGSYDSITYIPTADLFEDTEADLFAEDNFHPNHLGYQRIAKRVLEYLTN